MVEWEDLEGLIRYLPYGPPLWEAILEWPGEKIAQINTITEFINFSCGGDFMIYVETLLPALGELVLVFLDVGWDDVARSFFRPMGIRSRFKLRDGKKKKKKGKKGKSKVRFEIPEPSELIAKMLPGYRVVRGRKVGSLQKWFWRVDAVLQRALYYWMIADVTSDFVYTWATGIMRHERCYKSDAGWFRGGPGLWSVPANGNPTWAGAPLPHESGGQRPISGVPVVIGPGESVDIAVSVGNAVPFLDEETTYQLGIGVMDAPLTPDSHVWVAGDDKVPGVAVKKFVNHTDSEQVIAPWLVASCGKPNTLFLHDVIVAAVRRE